jgi:uncharacterized membrane protein YuzA (DUF378 family)
MKVWDVIVSILLIIGGLNFGIWGFFGVNLISMFFGEATALTRVIYAVFGLCALYEIGGFTFGFKSLQHRWCEAPASGKY